MLLLLSAAAACGDNLGARITPDSPPRIDASPDGPSDAANDAMTDAVVADSGVDGPLPDGSLPDGSLPDGSLPDGSLPDGPLPDGPLPDGPLPDGPLPDGPLPDAGVCVQTPVALGFAAPFAVLAGPSVTNTGPTIVTGDLGTSGTSVTGFGPGMVIGTQHVGNATALMAQMSLTTAYNDARDRPVGCATLVAGNIGGQTLPPGLYKSTGTLAVSSGDLTLDGQGNPNAVFIFQIAATLTTTGGRRVNLIGMANPANVFWQVGTSATIGTTSVVPGTIMANAAISILTGATLTGRALARIEGITLDSNVITRPPAI